MTVSNVLAPLWSNILCWYSYMSLLTWFFSKMCLWLYDKNKFSNRPFTRRRPSLSRKGSRCLSVLVFFTWWAFCKSLISLLYCSLCTNLRTAFVAYWYSAMVLWFDLLSLVLKRKQSAVIRILFPKRGDIVYPWLFYWNLLSK